MSVQTSVSTTPAVAFKGMLADDADNQILTMKNAEATASIPFGNVVSFKTSSPGSDKDAILPTSSAEKFIGIVVHKHNYERTWTLPDGTVAGELDSVGLVPGVTMNVLRKGRIWVQPETAVVPGDPLFVRIDSDTNENAFEYLGNVDNSSDESDMVDCTQIGTFLTSCGALGFAILDVDFTIKP